MTPTTIRYIGLHHIAFFRAAFESDLGLENIAVRYLETGADLRAAKGTLRRIQAALTLAAKRHGKHGQAALLRVPRARFRETAPDTDLREGIPTFDEFYAITDPNQDFSIREIQEMYEAEYGLDLNALPTSNKTYERRLERNNRLLKRRTLIINQLAKDIVVPPSLEDWIDGWFDTRIARRLTAGGITKLGDLILFMNHRGYSWYRVVPKLGKVSAHGIQTFLLSSALGDHLSNYALQPVSSYRNNPRPLSQARQLATESSATHSINAANPIIPIEQLVGMPETLNGTTGINRSLSPLPTFTANDDLTAIRAWLGLYSGNTFKAYRKEAERLLLWATITKGKPFSSLTVEDTRDFLNFLAAPQPTAQWVADRRYERFHSAWRPFIKKGLSQNGAAFTKQILTGMCAWLVKQGYLQANPFDGLPTIRMNKNKPIHRTISIAQWELLKGYVEGLDENITNIRKRFLIKLAYATGLRVHEIAKASMGDLQMRHFPDGERALFLSVHGKGGKVREVPIVKGIQRELATYLSSRGIQTNDLGDIDAKAPLIASIDYPQEHLGVRRILTLIKDICQATAEGIELKDPESARVLRAVSPHWMRHSNATHALYRGMPIASVRDNLGHASIQTTSNYIHTDLSERHQETEKFLQGI